MNVRGRRGRRRRQLQDDVNGRRGCWILNAFFGKSALEESM